MGFNVMTILTGRNEHSMTHGLRSAPRATAGIAALLLLSALTPGVADAATANTTMPVTMTITAGCTVTATSVAFGSQSVLAAATSGTGTLGVTCTNTTPYNVGLDAGSGAGATVAVRKMTGPASAIINYGLFQNAAFTTAFGNVVGTNTVAGTGIGTSQTITVYGQVPAQSSPAPGSYADVVNVTITF
jgi:spore coat protein U-like protein